jgi:acetyl esterase/lipase
MTWRPWTSLVGAIPGLLVLRCIVAAPVVALFAFGFVGVAAGQSDAPVSVEKRIPYVPEAAANQTVDVYRQEGPETGRVALVMVHGGGFAGGSPDDLSRQARLAARQGWVTFNLDYRTTAVLGTSGEAWPAEAEDVRAGIEWVRAHAAEYGADPRKIVLLGASAGGTLAALAAAEPDGPVRAVALWSAPTDLRTLVPDATGSVPACDDNIQCVEFWRNPWVTNLIGCTPDACPDRYDAASPVVQATGLPPAYVANASNEIVPVVQPEAFADVIRAGGVEVELEILSGSRHAQTYTESVWNETIEFLANQLGVPAPEPIDFDDSPFDLGWATLAILLAIVGIIVAVVAGVTRDRRGRSAP